MRGGSDIGAAVRASGSGAPDALEGAALRAAGRAVARAREEARPQWVALSTPGGSGRQALAHFARSDDLDRFYWERPRERFAFAALGAVAAIDVEGPERFGRAGRFARSVFERVTRAGGGEGPWLVGGFAFDEGSSSTGIWTGFPAGRWVLPERMVIERGGRTRLWLCLPVSPDDDPAALARGLAAGLGRLAAGPPGECRPGASLVRDASPEIRARADAPHALYGRRVREALDRIAAGELEKVVLARSVRVGHPDPIAPGRLLDALRASYPSCVTFAIARGDSAFVGASPERLVRLEGASGAVRTAAVAGSAPRGRSPGEDARLARSLLESPKERAEHAVVLRAVREALRPRCGELDGPAAPRILAIEGIQHLETPLEGRIPERDRKSTGVLELAGDLHPTPAVGGAPREAAARFLREHEGLDRGWYAAPVGWVDAAGGGELRVALRSALLRGNEATLFAGAGIVAGSDPDGELRETQLKLRALLGPLLEV